MKALVAIGKRASLAAVLAFAPGCVVPRSGESGDVPGIPTGPGLLAAVPRSSQLPRPSTSTQSIPDFVRSRDIVTVAHRTAQPPTPKPAAKDEALPTPRQLPAATTGTKPPSGLTLDQVINATLLADPQLRAGFEAINQANADTTTASLRPNPTLFTGIQLLPLTRPFTVTNQGGPPQQDVNLSYPIDWFLFGKRAAAMQATTLGVRVSEAEYANRVRQRVLEASTAYYEVLEAKALINLARQDVDNLKRLEGITENALAKGGPTQIELSRIRLDRLKSEQGARDAEKSLVGANARLRAILGRSDSDPTFDVSGTLEDEPALEPLQDEEALAVAEQNRPDLKSLHLKIAQANANIDLERRKAYPSVAPQLGYTRQYQRSIGFPDADSYSVAMTMSLPLFDRNQGNRVKAVSVAVQNQFELQAALIALRAEVVQAGQELRTSAANTRAVAGEQLKLARDIRDTINKAHEAGGQPLIDVLDAQRTYQEIYRLFITSRAGYGRAVMKYYATLGKQVAP